MNVVVLGVVENIIGLEEIIFLFLIKWFVILKEVIYVVVFFVSFELDYIIG